METTVTALEMRKKFGGILDRVVQNGDHVTIMRGNTHLATLIPAKEHQQQCSSKERLRTIEEALKELDEWKKRNSGKLKKMFGGNSTETIRRMRDHHWSSTHR